MENTKNEVYVGQLATGRYVSDCYPFEVIEVSPSGKTIKIREMNAEPAEGYDYFGNQVYNYTSNPNGSVRTVRLCKYGWKELKGTMKVSLGNARKYQDPHF